MGVFFFMHFRDQQISSVHYQYSHMFQFYGPFAWQLLQKVIIFCHEPLVVCFIFYLSRKFGRNSIQKIPKRAFTITLILLITRGNVLRNTIALVIFFSAKVCHTVTDKSVSFQNHNFLAVFINTYTTNPTWHGLACSVSKFCRALAEHPLAECLADLARWMLGERSSGVVNIYGLRHFSKAIDQEREYAYGNTIRPLPQGGLFNQAFLNLYRFHVLVLVSFQQTSIRFSLQNLIYWLRALKFGAKDDHCQSEEFICLSVRGLMQMHVTS